MCLLTHLAQVPDFRRQNKNFRHKLLDILVISVLATLSGADDFVEIADFGRQKAAILGRYLSLEHGPPSHDTIERVFQHLNAAHFTACFQAWMQELLPEKPLDHICLDGKTMRGVRGTALHVVSAVAAITGLCLTQQATDGKGQELAALGQVLDLLDVRGALVSIDALGCQPAIATQIHQQGGDYLLAVKANQPRLLEEVERALAPEVATAQERRWGSYNVPQRTQVTVVAAPWWVNEDKRWPALATLVRVETTTYPPDLPTTPQTVRYYISSRPDLTAEQAMGGVRSHWAIENKLHWRLDVTLGEDQHLLRHVRAAQNLTLVRKMALNFLAQKTEKGSVKVKRKRLAWNEELLEQQLADICRATS